MMTRKKSYLLAAAVVLVVTVAGCIVAFIFFPPAAAAVSAVGATAIGWCVTKALDKISENIDEVTGNDRATPDEHLMERTRTIHRHYSETDHDGHHIIRDTEETIIETDAPPRPHKPSLS